MPVILSLVFTLLISAFPARAGQGVLDTVVETLAAGVKDKPGIKLAVLEFPYTSGKNSEGPVVVQERITTALAKNKQLSLIERNLLNKVLGELKLQASGAVDEATAKKVGQLLGADALVTGTLNDISGEKTEVNARLVETASGKILSAASTEIKKTWKDTGTIPVTHGEGYSKAPVIQLAVLLDTSNSMDGLINQARNQIWKIINELNTSEKSGTSPVIEVAVYEYGNSSLPASGGYIRQVLPFTRNLDKVATELFALKTNGGDEFCGQVIQEAATNLNWSKKEDAYKAIFIAGNEPFTQGKTDFKQAVAMAKSKGIFVNTIFCGNRQEGVATQWLAAAQAADGDYATIDQNAQQPAITTPQDAQIAKASELLENTAIPYGEKGKAEKKNQSFLTSMVSAAGAAIQSERAAYKAAPSSAQAMADSTWDLLSALETGSIKRDSIKKDSLPSELQKMDKTVLNKYFDDKLAERKKLKAEILVLQAQRQKQITAEEKRQAGKGPETLDKAVLNSVRKQAVQKGYKFQ